MRKSEELLDQIIEAAEGYDLELKKHNIKGEASLTVGESWIIFHLKLLKDLLKQENES